MVACNEGRARWDEMRIVEYRGNAVLNHTPTPTVSFPLSQYRCTRIQVTTTFLQCQQMFTNHVQGFIDYGERMYTSKQAMGDKGRDVVDTKHVICCTT